VLVFAVTRLFDVALATAAATAAAAAGAHAAGAPLTSEILRNAAVGGALKSGAMVLAGLFLLAPQNTPFLVLPMLLGTSIATNVLLVAAMANRTIGYGEHEAFSPTPLRSLRKKEKQGLSNLSPCIQHQPNFSWPPSWHLSRSASARSIIMEVSPFTNLTGKWEAWIRVARLRYAPAFRVPITFTSIPFDVLGAYTFAKMADNLGKLDSRLRSGP
jgi:hypothetical protein